MMVDFTYIFHVISLALEQGFYYPSASKATL